MPRGEPPVAIRRSALLVRSIDPGYGPVELVAHPYRCRPGHDRVRPVAHLDRLHDMSGREIDPAGREVEGVRHPECVRREGHALGPGADCDRTARQRASQCPRAAPCRPDRSPPTRWRRRRRYRPGCRRPGSVYPLLPVTGSMRRMVSSPLFATQIPCASPAIAVGWFPTRMTSLRLLVAHIDPRHRSRTAVGDPHVVPGDGDRVRRRPPR